MEQERQNMKRWLFLLAVGILVVAGLAVILGLRLLSPAETAPAPLTSPTPVAELPADARGVFLKMDAGYLAAYVSTSSASRPPAQAPRLMAPRLEYLEIHEGQTGGGRRYRLYYLSTGKTVPIVAFRFPDGRGFLAQPAPPNSWTAGAYALEATEDAIFAKREYYYFVLE